MMGKLRLLLIFVLLVSLFSSGVLAAVPTAGDALRNLGTFFKGLVTGAASMDNAYFISFILYFILFLAIFIEGLRTIPIFGAKGELNKQGKVFGVAASALATIALFVVDQRTGVSTADRVTHLVAPFGIWGGMVIAGIVAFITYKMVKDSDLFKEEILMAMAIAAAVGVTFAGFLLSLENLLGWGFLIMLLVFIVGVIRAFTLKRGETAGDRRVMKEEKTRKEVERFKGAEKELKMRKEKERREKSLNPIKGFLVKCINAVEEGVTHLKVNTPEEAEKAKDKIKEFDENINIVWKELKKRRNKFKGEEKEELEKLAASAHNLVNLVVEKKFRKSEAGVLLTYAEHIIEALDGYKLHCGEMIKRLDKLME